jgi:RNA polymerase sigma factor (sigma-70 family)
MKGDLDIILQEETKIAGLANTNKDASVQLIGGFIQSNTTILLGSLRAYTQRMGLAQGELIPIVALEILQETVVEALEHAERFQPGRQPMAWLLGIAINVIKRKKAEQARSFKRETSISSLQPDDLNKTSESDIIDQISSLSIAGPEQEIETKDQVATLLALVSNEDRQVLELAFVYEFDRDAIAQHLHLTTGSARVKVHRALSRLRIAWREHQKDIPYAE